MPEDENYAFGGLDPVLDYLQMSSTAAVVLVVLSERIYASV